MNQAYVDTVRLLLLVAPHVFASGLLGLKGGTALNLFVEDMPRLSVDIDAVLLDHSLPRDAALSAIGEELARIKARLEVNQVFRGTVMPVEQRGLVAAAEALFTTSITLPVLAEPELYGSKLVAAFDRQHPRDWFDVRQLLQRDGLSAPVVACFVAYLAGHNRPVHEVLFPTVKSMQPIYDAEFTGMTRHEVPLSALGSARSLTLAALPRLLTQDQRQFLLSVVRAEPRWELMPFPHLSALPAVRWRLQNLQKLKKNERKFADQHDQLEARLAAT